jgi:hypothetical protein
MTRVSGWFVAVLVASVVFVLLGTAFLFLR